MAKPIPSPAQIDAINADIIEKTTQQTALAASAALQDPIIANKTLIDDAFRNLFDYYNDDIVGQYDAESKAIDGIFVTTPIVEQDIIDVAGIPPSGRLVPTPPTTDIVRISEFDGGNTSVTALNEEQHIADQIVQENLLQSGLTGTAPTITGSSLTTSALNGASTTLSMNDAAGPMSFAIGNQFLVTGSGEIAVVEVTGATDLVGGDPPYTWDLDIIFILPPTGAIASGASVSFFTGFTDGERSTKTASSGGEQPLMDELINLLETALQDRQARMAEQDTALTANDDPDGTVEIAAAQADIVTSDAFITTYLVSTDISDTGLTSLSTERGVRSPQLTARLLEITDAYTMQTEDYYDFRFNTSNDRGNTSRGTLREVSNSQSVKDTSLALAAALQDSIDALNGIIP